jgi:putative tryptophan/tyrosine transport system substrate-binding protein
MKKTIISLALVALLFALCLHLAEAQQAKFAKIGELTFGRRSGLGTGRELLRQELRALGYVEGKNIVFETRSAEGKPDRFATLADELVHLKVAVLVASSTTEAIAFKNATKTIPIVYVGTGDPVASGLVDSLARPGGNITGFTEIGGVLAGKRLELLKETIPKLSRVAVLWDPTNQGSEQSWKESQLSARELGLQLYSMEVSRADKYEGAFREATEARCAALAVYQGPLASFNQKQIVELAAINRLPAIYQRRDFVESGGLMSYGADRVEPYRRAAWMVDKILKGAKPADLPVEQPTKFELVINLKTAKTLGLTIPPIVMMRAERVIRESAGIKPAWSSG